MKNYICINGNKTELTEEQLKQLGIELPKESTFARADKYKGYYVIDWMGKVVPCTELKDDLDQIAFDSANYCTDKSIMEQRALQETLNRLLWRYSMEHDGDKMNFNNSSVFRYGIKYTIAKSWTTFHTNANLFGIPLFATEQIAENAIEEIIKPFMKAHPDFKF